MKKYPDDEEIVFIFLSVFVAIMYIILTIVGMVCYDGCNNIAGYIQSSDDIRECQK